MSDGYLGQAAFDLEILPARVAYLIRPRSSRGFRRAIEEASTRWAGMTEPIVPLGRRGRLAPWWKEVVDLLKVDALVNVDSESTAAEALSTASGIPLTELRHIDHAGPSRYSCNPVAIMQIAPTWPTSAVLPSDGTLWQATACGSLSDAAFNDMVGAGAPLARPTAEDQVGRAVLEERTLLDFSVAQFVENTATNGPLVSPMIVWVTRPNSLGDCMWYWNLRALRSLAFEPVPMLLLPDQGVEHWLEFGRQLVARLARPNNHAPDVLICSLRVDRSALHQLGQVLGLKQTEEGLRSAKQYPPPPNRQAPYTYRLNLDPRLFFNFGRSYGAVSRATVQLFREETELEFVSPVTFRHGGLVLARLRSNALSAYPRREGVARLIEPNASWRDGRLQLASLAQPAFRFRIALPGPEAAMEAVLHEANVRHQLSDKGKLGWSLAQQLDIDELLRPGVYEAVLALTTPRSKELVRELNRASRQGAARNELLEIAAEWGGRAQRRYRTARQLVGIVGSSTLDVVERLASIGWVERGLELRCQQCGVASFIPMQSATGSAMCPGCGSAQKYASEGRALRVVYRLNTFVDRASDQGVLPHLLAWATLARSNPSTHLLPGIDVIFPDGTAAEVDLIGLHGESVIAGEVKTNPSEFTPTRIREDVHRSAQLQADLHVLATPGNLPPEVASHAERATRRAGLRLLVLDEAALRPA